MLFRSSTLPDLSKTTIPRVGFFAQLIISAPSQHIAIPGTIGAHLVFHIPTLSWGNTSPKMRPSTLADLSKTALPRVGFFAQLIISAPSQHIETPGTIGGHLIFHILTLSWGNPSPKIWPSTLPDLSKATLPGVGFFAQLIISATSQHIATPGTIGGHLVFRILSLAWGQP